MEMEKISSTVIRITLATVGDVSVVQVLAFVY